MPIVLSLTKHLTALHNSSKSFTAFVNALLHNLYDRFAGIYCLLNMPIPATGRNDLHFDSTVFLVACAMDPMYAYQWLQDHPGTAEDKEAIRLRINGQ